MRHSEQEKAVAAHAAAKLINHGMTVGLGTGSTVAHLLSALARRALRIRCVATSPATDDTARAFGLAVESFDTLDKLDIAIDGADQVDPARWLVKGGGGAHTREKIVAAAAERFVVIISSEKLVDHISAPIPLELSRFGLTATLRNLRSARLRDAPSTPDGGVLADWLGPVDEPATAAAALQATPGVVEHGLFPPALVSDVIVGRGTTAELLDPE